MKKIASFIISFILTFACCTPVFAAGESASCSGNTSVTVGQNITLTFSLSGYADATSGGVTISHGNEFEIVSGTWLKSGVLVDFNFSNKQGVVAFDNATNINGNIFQLVLKARRVTTTSSEKNVSATFNMKNGETSLPQSTATWRVVVNEESLINQFVTRLYQVCLNREPDSAGKADWSGRLQRGETSGVQAAYGFIFSDEFKGKNLCNDDYVEQLYNAFMGRGSDPVGKAGWVAQLNSGSTREAIFNGFAFSPEFQQLCTDYGIRLGEGIGVPTYGTVPTGCCSVCGKEDGVTGFVKRLYQVCLGREADPVGLADWTNRLWNHTASGSGTAYGFIFSNEFISKNYSNEDYVEYLYHAFMGRGSDPIGKAGWVNQLNSGSSKYDVFNGFVGSQEFMGICNSYGIVR